MNFMYSPEGEMILVDDEQYEKMLDNKLWFSSPSLAAVAKVSTKKAKKAVVEEAVVAEEAVVDLTEK